MNEKQEQELRDDEYKVGLATLLAAITKYANEHDRTTWDTLLDLKGMAVVEGCLPVVFL